MRPGLLRHLGAGLVLGAGTGSAARGFMALFTSAPEFSWAGTGLIVALFAVAGVALAGADHARRSERSGWWRLLALPAVLLGLGQGALLVPGYVGFALLPSRRPWVRAAGTLMLLGELAVLALVLRGPEPFTVRTALGVVLLVGCCAAVGVGARTALTGWRTRERAVATRLGVLVGPGPGGRSGRLR